MFDQQPAPVITPLDGDIHAVFLNTTRACARIAIPGMDIPAEPGDDGLRGWA